MNGKKSSCTGYCTARTFDRDQLTDFFMSNFKASLIKDVIQVSLDEGRIFIFTYGISVFWNISHDRTMRVLHDLKRFEHESFSEPCSDEFTYSTDSSQVKVHEDHIYLTSDDPFFQLSLSHGIAQSLKLATLEAYAQHTIEATSMVPHNIAKTGKSLIKRKDISKMQGRLFIVDMDINLTYELLDTPEFFWEFPEVEHLYNMMIRYLDVRPRIEILDKKVTVIRELFSMLADEQKHKHSAMLEWIIIWLIAIEIIFFLVKEL